MPSLDGVRHTNVAADQTSKGARSAESAICS
jgi:hypothetical protein